MNFATFTKKLRLATGTDNETLPWENIAVFVNAELEQFSLLATLPWLQETYLWVEIDIDTTDNQRKYAILDNIIRTHWIEYRYGEIPVRMKETTLTRLDWPIVESEVQRYFRDRLPSYSLYGNFLYLWTWEDIEWQEWAIKIFASVYPTEFEAEDFEEDNINEMTTKSELPRQFHQILLKRVIITYKESRDKPIALTQGEQMFAWELATVLRTMRVLNTSRRYSMSEPKDWFYYEKRKWYDSVWNDTEKLLVQWDWVFLTI